MNLFKIVKYNIKIIFGNKFIYFLGASFFFYLLTTTIDLFSDSVTEVDDIYYQLVLPGILLIFYPTVYAIENDKDSNILEVLFTIPNYRYKIWLIRLLITYVIVFVIVLFLVFLDNYILVNIPVFVMSIQLMVLLFFLGGVGFFLATLVRNGNGAAVVMVLVSLLAWIGAGVIGESKWNILLNPFSTPKKVSEVIYQSIVFQNRLMIITVTIVLIVASLFNMQKREKYI